MIYMYMIMAIQPVQCHIIQFYSSAGFIPRVCLSIVSIWNIMIQGRIEDFKLGGGAQSAPSGERRENCWGISCEKSRFYAKKSYFFFNFRGDTRRVRPHPLDLPLWYFIIFFFDLSILINPLVSSSFFLYIMSLLMCFIDRHDITEILA